MLFKGNNLPTQEVLAVENLSDPIPIPYGCSLELSDLGRDGLYRVCDLLPEGTWIPTAVNKSERDHTNDRLQRGKCGSVLLSYVMFIKAQQCFLQYGSCRPLDMMKTMSEDVQTFSTIGQLFLRASSFEEFLILEMEQGLLGPLGQGIGLWTTFSQVLGAWSPKAKTLGHAWLAHGRGG